MKRKISLFLTFILMLSTIFSVNVFAVSYPSIYPENYTVIVQRGEIANLKFSIFRQFENEKYHVNIYKGTQADIDNGNAKLVSSGGGTVESTDRIAYVTLTWNTSNVEPGIYTAEYYMSFYTFYQWRETPDRKKLLTIKVEEPKTHNDSFKKEISVIVGGNKVIFDQPPIIEYGRTLVPLRAIFEALGANVVWDDNTQMVTATKGAKNISLRIGSANLYVDGVIKTLDVSAKLIGGRTFVPVRAISEAFGCNVGWDSHSQTVIINQ